MNNPAISVVMPVFNSEKFLEEALESVLNQTYTNFEFIIINDGSTDNSIEILNKYAKLDKRCIIYSWLNKGIVTCLNFGIQKAKAKIIARMDSDDICEKDRFQKQLNYLETHQECVAVGSRVTIIDPDGLPFTNDWFEQITHDEIDALNMTGYVGSSICHPSVMYRKQALIDIGCYRQKLIYAEDYDLFLRLAENGKLANLSDFLLRYRVHSKSIGHAKRQEQLQATYQALAQAYERRKISIPSQLISDLKKNQKTESNSEVQMYRTRGWVALNNKYLDTARKYAIKILLREPLSFQSWKFLLCVMRGY